MSAEQAHNFRKKYITKTANHSQEACIDFSQRGRDEWINRYQPSNGNQENEQMCSISALETTAARAKKPATARMLMRRIRTCINHFSWRYLSPVSFETNPRIATDLASSCQQPSRCPAEPIRKWHKKAPFREDLFFADPVQRSPRET